MRLNLLRSILAEKVKCMAESVKKQKKGKRLFRLNEKRKSFCTQRKNNLNKIFSLV